MDYLIIILISVFIVFLLVSVLLIDTKTSNKISRKGNKLTLWHPLKKEEIDLEKDLKSWNVQRLNLLWRGRFYALNMELKSGKWKKIYTRSLSGKTGKLIAYLEINAQSNKKDYDGR